MYKPSWQITSFGARKMENGKLAPRAQLAAFASWQETKMESAKVAATANNNNNNNSNDEHNNKSQIKFRIIFFLWLFVAFTVFCFWGTKFFVFAAWLELSFGVFLPSCFPASHMSHLVLFVVLAQFSCAFHLMKNRFSSSLTLELEPNMHSLTVSFPAIC